MEDGQVTKFIKAYCVMSDLLIGFFFFLHHQRRILHKTAFSSNLSSTTKDVFQPFLVGRCSLSMFWLRDWNWTDFAPKIIDGISKTTWYTQWTKWSVWFIWWWQLFLVGNDFPALYRNKWSFQPWELLWRKAKFRALTPPLVSM